MFNFVCVFQAVLFCVKKNVYTQREHQTQQNTTKQNEIKLNKTQGERSIGSSNMLLNTFNLKMSELPENTKELQIEFEIDPNGILKITIFTNNNEVIVIYEGSDNDGRLSMDEIDNILNQADQFEQFDKIVKCFKNVYMYKNFFCV